MKKTFTKVQALASVLVLALAATFGTVPAKQVNAAETTNVYVSIANGTVVLANEVVTVTDIDNDGALTINDALYCAHEKSYTGGAAAGYGSATGAYGLSLTKLWGVENGGAYGYYVNNASAWSLADPVKNGDVISAFVYQDTAAYSDSYAYFDVANTTAKKGDTIKLTLYGAGYDANWNPVTVKLAGAVITVNGKTTEYTTDANGEVTIKLTESGKTVISANSETQNLVPPVCVVNGGKLDSLPKTEDEGRPGIGICLSAVALLLLSGSAYALRKKNNQNEN